jgi:apolipoprotein N-acyltransferase
MMKTALYSLPLHAQNWRLLKFTKSNYWLQSSILGCAAGLAFLIGWPLLTALLFIFSLRHLVSKPPYLLILFGAFYMMGSSVWFFPGTDGIAQLAGAIIGTLLLGVVFHGIPHLLLKIKYGWIVWPFAITSAEFIAAKLGLVSVPMGLVGLHTPLGLLAMSGSLAFTSLALTFLMALAIRSTAALLPICTLTTAAYLFVGLPYETKAIPIEIAAISHNPPSAEKWHPDIAPKILKDLIERTSAVGNVDLVVWPENAVTTTFELGKALDQLAALDKPLLFGMTRYKDYGKHDLVNSAVLRAGGDIQLSNKKALVPIIESGFRPFLEPVIHKSDRNVFELENGMRFLTLLCYEVSFSIPREDLDYVDFIIVISAETGLFTQMTNQVYGNMAIARSIETGLPTLRVGDAY